MNDFTVLGNALSTLVSLAILTFIVLWQYRAYRIDKFRDDIFAIRDRLFDYAARGGIDFDHPAYGMTRTTLNGFIRFGDRITLGMLWSTVRLMEKYPAEAAEFHYQAHDAWRQLNDDQRKTLEALRVEVGSAVIEQIMLVSTVPLLGMMLIAYAHRTRKVAKRVRAQWFRKYLEQASPVVFNYGKREHAAQH